MVPATSSSRHAQARLLAESGVNNCQLRLKSRWCLHIDIFAYFTAQTGPGAECEGPAMIILPVTPELNLGWS